MKIYEDLWRVLETITNAYEFVRSDDEGGVGSTKVI
jgi:hypothetical protein